MLKAPAQITIKTKDGGEFSDERMVPIGAPEEPLTSDDFFELFSKFSRGMLPDDQINKVAEMVMNLEELNDVSELMDMIT